MCIRDSSSLLGAFTAHGPYKLVRDPVTNRVQEIPREVSWADDYNVLFLDQPLSVGYSFADNDREIPRTSLQAAVHVYNFLQNFFMHKDFVSYRDTPLYIFGESYAGKYITEFAQYILKKNSENKSGSLKIKLTGIGLGNAIVDPYNQVSELASFVHSIGYVDKNQRDEIEGLQMRFAYMYKRKDYFQARNFFDQMFENIEKFSGRHNFYDIRLAKAYNRTDFIEYLNYPETLGLYGVHAKKVGRFDKTSMIVYTNFQDEVMEPFMDRLRYIVSEIPVIVFAGQMDLILNVAGISKYLGQFEWSGASEFRSRKLKPFKFNGKIAGAMKSYGNLYYAVVHKAGHMVTGDQTAVSKEMLRNFINLKREWQMEPSLLFIRLILFALVQEYTVSNLPFSC
eukprot:TRINITY_DN13756_c0_g1_i3.p1 TRINITY_DN13756_c0_g1~~TRINITY_DN13756_c0_g1_i3.p1  ORF type:complete len:396 (-),score=53.36 TRINITY_DN13756_c0_g1_i3:123-1310(-)